jgi:hypothetical protein
MILIQKACFAVFGKSLPQLDFKMSKAKGRTPRTDDDDDTRPTNNEGAGLIKNNGKIDAVHDEIKETQGVLLKTMYALFFSLVALLCLSETRIIGLLLRFFLF